MFSTLDWIGKVHVICPLLALMSFSPYRAVVSKMLDACGSKSQFAALTRPSTKACAASGDADVSGVPIGLALAVPDGLLAGICGIILTSLKLAATLPVLLSLVTASAKASLRPTLVIVA